MQYQDREAERYQLGDDGIVCTVRDASRGLNCVVRLNNVSTGGAQFETPDRLRKGEPLTVELQTGDVNLVLASTVRWTVPDTDGWVVGCQFEEPIDESYLDQFGRAGVLERRKHQRIPVQIECGLSAAGSPTPQSCNILDYSNGGLCIETPAPLVVGHKTRVTLGQGNGVAQVYAVVCWVESGIAGLRFLREEDSEAFLDCVEMIVI